MTNTLLTIGILVFDDVEELDFVGPLEVFGIAKQQGVSLKTVLVGKTHVEVRAHYGLVLKPEATFASCPPLDLLIVPGGPGARGHVRHDGHTLDFVKRQEGEIASVCTGSLILAAAHVLDGKKATTHRDRLDLLSAYGAVQVQRDTRMVFDGRVATSAGITAGIDLALAIVGRRWGLEMAEKVASVLEWDKAGEWKAAFLATGLPSHG